MAKSDLIAVGQTIGISRGAIDEVEGYHGRRQEVWIKFKIERVLLGEAPREITIRAYSTSYMEDGASHGSTAGFSDWGVKANEKYLAYLILRGNNYCLASDSNQFFEHVDETANRIRANGQTGEYVNLKEKLGRIATLAERRSNRRQ